LAESPTGVGKTLATLFPAVKAQGLGLAGPVFYLTARTTGQGAAEKALNEIGSAGGRVRWVTLTAKEKICPQPDVPCHPNFCSYAKGYFDRLSAALEESFGRDDHPASVNQETAHRHGLCPFEWSLDLALTVDVIVADYNYAFDPRVYLRRFFDFGRDYVFLVDEAHQLVDRARAMFSARIVHSKIRGLARDMAPQAPDVEGRLWDLDDWLSRARNRTGPEGGAWADSSLPEDFLPLLSRVIEATTRYLGQTPVGTAPKELVEFLVDSLHLTAMASGGEENGGQAVGYETNGDDLTLTVFCLDPSRRLARAFRRSRSVVLFSATLTPPDFYQTVLGLEEDAAKIRLASPFPMENLKVLVADRVSTRYRDREKTLALVTKLIRTLVEARPGHYLAFFPSHSYLEAARMDLMAGRPSFEILVQTPEMPETGRAAFLDRFHASGNGTVLGLAALGGIFGEGIDLAGDRLTGAVVVGVGLPGLGLEQNLIRDHYETRYEAGFEYAALFPGMRRVRQAAGRVIRSETDRGVVLLVDDRFGAARYRDLFPPWWTPKKVRDPQDLARSLTEFWNPIHPLNADSR
jgi:DNA excision repair protein ERCC-2